MNIHVIWALTIRYFYLYKRNWIRPIEMFFWPVMNLVVWGFISLFLRQANAGESELFASYMLGAMILWDIMFRSQQAVSLAFLEDVWTKNILNVFVAPVRLHEYIMSAVMVGVIRVSMIGILLVFLGQVFYAFDLLVLDIYLIPFFLNLLLFGWSLGMLSTALIVRFGQSAESLAWAIPFMVQPVAAVFYPLSVLPYPLQIIGWFIPCTHIFEGMRSVLATGAMNHQHLWLGTVLNIICLGICSWVFYRMFRYSQNKGLLTKVATQ